LSIDSSGNASLLASLTGEWLNAEAKLWSFAPEGVLGLDYSLQLLEWEPLADMLSSDWAEFLDKNNLDCYVDPIADGISCLDVAGYSRWDASQPDQVRSTLLGNVGPIEVFGTRSDISCRPASFGIASDGDARLKAFLELPVVSLRHGNWEQTEGLMRLKFNEGELQSSLGFSDSGFQLELAHRDWLQALSGDGELLLNLSDPACSQDVVSAFAAEWLPQSLGFHADIDASLRFAMQSFELQDVSGFFRCEHGSGVLLGEGVGFAGIVGQLNLASLLDPCLVADAEVAIEALVIASVETDDLKTSIQFKDTGMVSVNAFSTGLFGGQLSVGDFEFERATLTVPKVVIHVRELDLTQLAQKVPQFKGQVSGRVSGEMTFRWLENGPIAEDGWLSLDDSTAAHLSYNLEGFLTRGMSSESPSFEQYRMAEYAFEDLSLKRLRIDLFPGDRPHQAACLNFYGESQQGDLLVPVDYTLNVNVDDRTGLLQLLQMMQRGELEFN
jgi:hypothetical protein